MIIGVCGKACAGKNIVCQTLVNQYGYNMIDADIIGKQALQACKAEIIQAFGHDILTLQGDIDRKKLGTLVFSSPTALTKLNQISHPFIIGQIRHLLQQNPRTNWVVNAALLPYWRIPEIRHVFWVHAPLFLRFIRALKRDRRGFWFTIKRIWSQRTLSPQLFENYVDKYMIVGYKNQTKIIAQHLSLLVHQDNI
jgi:dephospho-CoA kinase